jgi:hypothetical protein
VTELTARLSLCGPFWDWKGWPDVYAGQTDPRERRRLVEARENPRASFPPYAVETPWDAIQVAYFAT